LELEKLTFNVDEAGKALGISRSLAYEMVRTGKLPVIRFGKRMLIPRKAVENMLANPPQNIPS
jgi:excisionase family DNA binding protein